ncbi:MAG: aminoglycoside phosphotransferase family protein [Candidatus Roizmanbacteria bacterium]|nr:aminoglycoside phosphotransferase family protein [Candidatus Roizmanbacteria bacterium]
MTKQIHRAPFDTALFTSIIGSNEPNAVDIHWLEDGWDFVVGIACKNAYRFPRSKVYEHKLPVEAAFLKQFKENCPVQVPDLKLHTHPQIGNYAAYPFIEGVPCSRKLVASCGEKDRNAIAHTLGAFLRALHTFPVEQAQSIGITKSMTVLFWKEKYEKLQKTVFPYVKSSQQNWINDIFAQFIEIIENNPVKNTVIHSDIMPEHILIDQNTHALVGIIDFGDVTIADPAYDFGFLHKYGADFLSQAYKGYGRGVDKTFDTRRQFYEDRLVVSNLEHAVLVQDTIWIERRIHELEKYVSAVHT